VASADALLCSALAASGGLPGPDLAGEPQAASNTIMRKTLSFDWFQFFIGVHLVFQGHQIGSLADRHASKRGFADPVWAPAG